APGMQVSHETIYRSLFIQTRGVLKKALMAQLRTTRQMRQAKGGTTKSGLGQIVDAASIRERPAEADDRAVPGHWEGDLLSGANNTHIATLVERHTRFVMLLKVPSKDTASVVAALGKHVRKLPQELRRSLTWDRGKEMARRPLCRPRCIFRQPAAATCQHGGAPCSSHDVWFTLLRSVGFEPAEFNERAKRVALLRMIPFVERNYNLVELGPRGTGKSHLFQQVRHTRT